MKYTARTISKNITNGLLTVEVEYRSEDGLDIFNDRVQTRSAQDNNWLQNEVSRRLKELETIADFKDQIVVGSIVEPVVTENTLLEDKDVYRENYKKFTKMVGALRSGLMDQKDEEFIALQIWLKNNFNSNYLDII